MHSDNSRHETTSRYATIKPLLDSIRHSPSSDPSSLPLRQKQPLTNDTATIDSRKTNKRCYNRAKKLYLMDHLGLDDRSTPGIYCFLDRSRPNAPLYYLGLAESLYMRLSTHLTRRDFVFYAIAFPEKAATYEREAIDFYASKEQYKELKATYRREMRCLSEAPFDTIAWVSFPIPSPGFLEIIETHFIYEFKPCVNVSKKDHPKPTQYQHEYENIKKCLLDCLGF